jgi:hypothetical protein
MSGCRRCTGVVTLSAIRNISLRAMQFVACRPLSDWWVSERGISHKPQPRSPVGIVGMRQPLVSTSRGEVPPRPLVLRKTGLRSCISTGEPAARAPACTYQRASQRPAHLSVTLRVHINRRASGPRTCVHISKGGPEARAPERNPARAH